MSKISDALESVIVREGSELYNPMFTVGEASNWLYEKDWSRTSRAKEYAATYRLLEKMVKKGLLFCCGTTNQGNVYIVVSRVVSNGDIPF